MTDEQLQKLIEHKVQEAVGPHRLRWESLRKAVDGCRLQAEDRQGQSAYASVIFAMDSLCKLETETEPRRKLPTDPRKVKK
jgi:hypothetical protein